jgi:molybdate transport system substrate-binding protein
MAAELKLLSSMAPRELLQELAARYKGGARIRLEAAGGVDVAKRVRAGEELDLVVLARNSIDELAREGALDADSVSDLAESGIGIAVRAGAIPPDVADLEALKQTVAAARSVSYSTGPSGVYLEKLFASWGMLEGLRSRIVVPPPGRPVGKLVSEGQVELGFQQLSELIGVPGITVLGVLPESVQLLTRFAGGVSRRSREPYAAREFLVFMSGSEHAAVRKQCGMQ